MPETPISFRSKEGSSSSPCSESCRSESNSCHDDVDSSMAPLILYSCIVRQACQCCSDDDNDDDENTLLLVHGGAQRLVQKDVNFTALKQLEQKINLGWDAFDAKPYYRHRRGLKFHVYQEVEDEATSLSTVQIYVYACVYDSKRCNKALAQAFLVKLVQATEELRLHDNDWKHGLEMLASQDSCGFILQQHMDQALQLPGSVWMQPVKNRGEPSPGKVNAAVGTKAMALARERMLQNRIVMSNHAVNMAIRVQLLHTNIESSPSTPSRMIIHVPTDSPVSSNDSVASFTSCSESADASPEASTMDLESCHPSLHQSLLVWPGEDGEEDRSTMSPSSVETKQTVKSAHEQIIPLPNKVTKISSNHSSTDSSTSRTDDFSTLDEPVRPAFWCFAPGVSSDNKLTMSVLDDALHSIRDDENKGEAARPCFFLSAWFSPRPSLLENK